MAFFAAYAPDAGHGFIKDDFRWIRETRLESPGDAVRLLGRTDGFYRPLVSLTFSLNSAAGGLAPRAYGLTNVALAIAAAVLVWCLARRLGLRHDAALLAAGAWAFNFHGINMAVLWVSGRTALVVTIGALLTGLATVAGRAWLAGFFCLLALLSKEEAVLLPAAMIAWCAYDADGTLVQRMASALRRTWPCFAALAVYLVLRMQTDAFWPADAPTYYRLSFSPATLAANVLQYADRALTWPLVAALVVLAAAARRPILDEVERRAILFGAIWLACTFALTIFVPVRSSLYAVLPSVGSAIAAGAIASAAMRAESRRTRRAIAALVILPFLLIPIYWRRNERWVRLADLSTAVIEQVRTIAAREPGKQIVIVDNTAERFNLEAAFGSLWPDAAALFLPPAAAVEIANEPKQPRTPDAVTLRLEGGRLVPIERQVFSTGGAASAVR